MSFDHLAKIVAGSWSCSFIPNGPPAFANFLEVAFEKMPILPARIGKYSVEQESELGTLKRDV
jgi:hypothetical protein